MEWSWRLNGLPLHPLFVHLTAVALPAAVLLVLAWVFWPRARRVLDAAPWVVSAVGAVSVQLAESSGEVLKEQVEGSAALERHAQLAELMMPWALGLTVTSLLAWYWWRVVRDAEASRLPGAARVRSWADRGPGWVSPTLAALAVVAAVGTLVVVVLVGDAGARAVWAS